MPISDTGWLEQGSISLAVNGELRQRGDLAQMIWAVDEVIAANPDQAAAVKEKPKSMGWFVGQVMKASGGKANPQAVNKILRDKLGL